MRIQKYLSEQGVLSRREAEKYIQEGRIKLNGSVVREMGVQMDPEKDLIEVTGLDLHERKVRKMTVVVYKPRGVTSSKNRAEGKTVFETFPKFKDLNAVGRLDKESEGLLLLSNDGVITAAVTGENHSVEKEYEVTVREEVRNWHLEKMTSGIMLDGKKTKKAKAELRSPHTFRIILTEGRTHQIRRMADAVHLTIQKLTRIRIHTITIASLRGEKSRTLTEKEVLDFKKIRRTQ